MTCRANTQDICNSAIPWMVQMQMKASTRQARGSKRVAPSRPGPQSWAQGLGQLPGGSPSSSGGCWAPEPVQRQDKALNSSHSGLGLQDAVAA